MNLPNSDVLLASAARFLIHGHRFNQVRPTRQVASASVAGVLWCEALAAMNLAKGKLMVVVTALALSIGGVVWGAFSTTWPAASNGGSIVQVNTSMSVVNKKGSS